jgi:hypothetical protein
MYPDAKVWLAARRDRAANVTNLCYNEVMFPAEEHLSYRHELDIVP